MAKKTSSSAPPPPTAALSVDYEAIDLYGNWKVKKLTFKSPVAPFGLEKNKSKFKIRNKGTQHVLIKKSNVDWNGNDTEIPLTELSSVGGSQADQALYNANFRLKAMVTFNGDGSTYRVAFGSDDNGETLHVDAESAVPQPNPGGFGTAGRGG
jgi:hypothetical protein